MASNRSVRACLRRKITIACESCRQRKVRCSGTAPCSLCSKHKQNCIFDTNRQRRGPRAKSAEGDGAQLAIGSCPTTVQASGSPDDGAVISDDVRLSVEFPIDSALPETVAIRRRLQQHFTKTKYPIDHISDGTISHLLEIFFTIANVQQLPLLPPDHGIAWLLSLDHHLSLIMALCSMSLAYSSAKVTPEGQLLDLEQRVVSACRLSLLEPGYGENSHLDRLVCLSALASYEASHGNGAQAWCDIGTAQSIVPLVPRSNLPTLSHIIFETACDFLSWLRVGFAIGNAELVSSVSLYSGFRPKFHENTALDDPHTNITDAGDLLFKCAEYSSRDTMDDLTLPWDRDSKLMLLRLRLDKFSMAVVDTSEVDIGAFGLGSRNTSGLAVGLLMILVRDCCSILINRDFLPILPSFVHSQAEHVPYSQAPRMFVEGRVNACEASAESIYNICTHILSNNVFFMSPLLGFCCFQASIVFLHSYEDSVNQRERIEYQDKLKVLLAILLALTKFYEPAKLWVDVFLRINRLRYNPTSTMAIPNLIKPTFFSRFGDIHEPPFVSLSKEVDQKGTPKDVQESTSKLKIGAREDSTAWMEQYRRKLRDHVTSFTRDDIQIPGTGIIPGLSDQGIGDLGLGESSNDNIQHRYMAPMGSAMEDHLPMLNNQVLQYSQHPGLQDDTSNLNRTGHYTDLNAISLPTVDQDNIEEQLSMLPINNNNPLQSLLNEINLQDANLPEWDLSQYVTLADTTLDIFGFKLD